MSRDTETRKPITKNFSCNNDNYMVSAQSQGTGLTELIQNVNCID